MKPLDRPLDRAEAFFWLLDRCSSMNFAILAQGEGVIAPEGLRGALSQAQEIHPALSVAIETDEEGRLAFVPRPGRPIPVRTEEAGESWRARIAAVMVEPFALGEAPLARAHWFDLPGGRWAFALVFHHAIGDGRSGMRLAIEILDEARGGVPQAPRTGQSHSLIALFPESLSGEKGAAGAAAWKAGQRAAPRGPKPDPLPGFVPAEGEPLASMVSLELEPDTVASLAARSRDNGASVHGAIGAAELIAARERFDSGVEPALMLTSPVDLRGALKEPVDDSTPGFYVTLLSSTGRVAGREAFWELARHITGDLRRQLAEGLGHLFYHLIPAVESMRPDAEVISGFRAYMARMPQAYLLSNVGRIAPLPDAGSARIDEVSFALCPMGHQPLFVAATTWGGRMILNVNYDARRLAPEIAKSLASGIESVLREAAAGRPG